MGEIKIRNVTFPDAGSHSAKVEFVTSNAGGSAQVLVSVVLKEKDGTDVLQPKYKTVVDDVDVVREAQQKLHQYATLLVEQTKDWSGS